MSAQFEDSHNENSTDIEKLLGNLTSSLADSYQEISTLTQAMEELSEEKVAAQEKAKEMETLRVKYREKTRHIDRLKEQLASLTPRNINKRIKRRDDKLREVNELMKQKNEEISDFTKQTQELQDKLGQIIKEKKNLQKNKSFWKRKAMVAERSDIQLQQARDRIYELENENQEMKEKIDELLQNEPDIKTFENGKYNDNIRQIYYDLLAHNVSIESCSAIVKSVIKNLLNVEIDRLPSKSLISMMQVEALVVAQAQAASEILEQPPNNTLHSDGTRKKFIDYAGLQVTLPDKRSLSLGFQELLSGTADDYISATIDTFKELSEAVTDDDRDRRTIYAQLLLQSKNIMSDRHVVNRKYKSKLEELRESLLPIIEANWEKLSETEKTKMKRVNHLLCGMHVLTNIATAVSTSSKVFEKENKSLLKEEKPLFGNDSRCFSLLYQASKGFTDSGCQKSGVYTDFYPYLDDLKEKNFLTTFQHHRFNVAFHQGAAVYYHRNHIADFLKSGRCNSTNQLVSQVEASLSEDLVMAECRALGILDKLVTGPLMRLLERTDINYYDMNVHWLELKTCLADNAIDASPLLAETAYLSDTNITKDELYLALFPNQRSAHSDTLTAKVLQSFCQYMLPVVERQVGNQLPGGLESQPDCSVMAEVVGAPLTNVRSESDFSDLDRQINRAPQKSRLSKAGIICYTRNKTASYLNKLPQRIKSKYLMIARKVAPRRKIKEQKHSKNLKKLRLELQKERIEKKQRQLQRKQQQRQQLELRIRNKWGVWKSEIEVDEKLRELNQSQQMKALKDQILYRIDILKVRVQDKKLRKWQQNGTKLSILQLADNLKCLISADGELPNFVNEINMNLMTQRHEEQKEKAKKRKRKTKKAIEHQFGVKGTVEPGTYIAVAYEDGWFAGEVCEVLTTPDNSILVNFLSRNSISGNSFRWPTKIDVAITENKFILKQIEVEPKDSLLRAWSVKNIAEIENLYHAFRKKFF
ncbi:putative protein tag-278 [Ptychodera flava]|uniref:putative protein tag-278 n=1 Tax=Ptychodera flava TaxID=63121 RepID=UPI00396A5BF2